MGGREGGIIITSFSHFTAQGTDFTFDPVENIAIRDLQTFPHLDPNPRPVNFSLIKDGVERETNEVFTLVLELTSGFQAANAFFTQRLEVTIQDGDDSLLNSEKSSW